MTHRAELALDCGSARLADLLLRTLSVEATEGPEGATVHLRQEGDVVHAAITAPGLSTLRAAINSVARQADTALRSMH